MLSNRVCNTVVWFMVLYLDCGLYLVTRFSYCIMTRFSYCIFMSTCLFIDVFIRSGGFPGGAKTKRRRGQSM